jgi:general secretion pathway protein B
VSYILDALRKLERERQPPAAAHDAALAAPPPPPRRSLVWPIVGGAALAVNVILIGLLVWPTRAPQPTVAQDVAIPAPSARTATPPPSVAAAPARVPAEAPAVAAEPVATPAPPRPAPARVEHPPAPPAGPARSAPARRTTTTPVAPPAERASPAPATVAATVPAGAPRLKLEVLVYSEAASERFVFINGRKFTEGQRVDEGVVLERIQPDSAVLSYQDQKFVLRE